MLVNMVSDSVITSDRAFIILGLISSRPLDLSGFIRNYKRVFFLITIISVNVLVSSELITGPSPSPVKTPLKYSDKAPAFATSIFAESTGYVVDNVVGFHHFTELASLCMTMTFSNYFHNPWLQGPDSWLALKF